MKYFMFTENILRLLHSHLLPYVFILSFMTALNFNLKFNFDKNIASAISALLI